jgi:HTH-type transcriptional regulator, sugar sensing transcriptional regulator
MEFEQIRETLKRIGLGHNESKIYLTLLKLGPSMAGRIAKESNIDRSASYDSLKALLKKGLISYSIEANRKKFAAANPEKLKSYLQEKEELVESVLGNLKDMYQNKEEKSQVNMFKGIKGMKTVFEDILHSAKGKENLVIDSSGKFGEKMPYFMPHFVKAVEKNKISIRHIARRDKENTLNSSKTTAVRFFPRIVGEQTITTNIYADKVAIILWTDVPEAVIIKNKAAAEAYKSYFEILWTSAKK